MAQPLQFSYARARVIVDNAGRSDVVAHFVEAGGDRSAVLAGKMRLDGVPVRPDDPANFELTFVDAAGSQHPHVGASGGVSASFVALTPDIGSLLAEAVRQRSVTRVVGYAPADDDDARGARPVDVKNVVVRDYVVHAHRVAPERSTLATLTLEDTQTAEIVLLPNVRVTELHGPSVSVPPMYVVAHTLGVHDGKLAPGDSDMRARLVYRGRDLAYDVAYTLELNAPGAPNANAGAAAVDAAIRRGAGTNDLDWAFGAIDTVLTRRVVVYNHGHTDLTNAAITVMQRTDALAALASDAEAAVVTMAAPRGRKGAGAVMRQRSPQRSLSPPPPPSSLPMRDAAAASMRGEVVVAEPVAAVPARSSATFFARPLVNLKQVAMYGVSERVYAETLPRDGSVRTVDTWRVLRVGAESQIHAQLAGRADVRVGGGEAAGMPLGEVPVGAWKPPAFASVYQLGSYDAVNVTMFMTDHTFNDTAKVLSYVLHVRVRHRAPGQLFMLVPITTRHLSMQIEPASVTLVESVGKFGLGVVDSDVRQDDRGIDNSLQTLVIAKTPASSPNPAGVWFAHWTIKVSHRTV